VNTNNSCDAPNILVWLTVGLVVLGSAIGCSPRNEKSSGQNGPDGGTVMVEADPAVNAALTRMEATGKLEGVTFEHFVGGGLPPPYFVADQLLLVERDGHDTIEFAAPNYKAQAGKDKPYPNDEYQLAAQPDDVKAIARALRESHAFEFSSPKTTVADAIRTELVLTVAGKKHTSVYREFTPALAPLNALVRDLTARAKAHGRYRLSP
jgi:hypothetical protein